MSNKDSVKHLQNLHYHVHRIHRLTETVYLTTFFLILKVTSTVSVNYRFPTFFPILGEHSGNHGQFSTGEDVCSMCVWT